MKNYKKTFLGSLVAFFVGTSCCWLSSLAIWIGGVAFFGTITNLIEDVQVFLIILGTILLIITLFSYLKMRKKNDKKRD
jgi:DMSO/TMAO reductase YedYZ heme-binding membrane subunit